MTASVIGGLSLVLLLSSSGSLPKLIVPNSPDLMIKVERTSRDSSTTIETLYLKGSRQRRESATERTVLGRRVRNDFVEILQCDQRQRINLNPAAKTYVQSPIEDWSEKMKRAQPVPQGEAGPDVNVTIDSTDTGEKRQFGHYVARHVKTTTRVLPSPGASTPARDEEVDGWYIELPGLSCQERSNGVAFLTAFSSFRAGAPPHRDHIQIKRLGSAPHGYAVAEKTQRTEDGRTTVSELELVEFSEAALDPALFTLPAGYNPALHNVWGGYDMTKPNTLANRAQQYWVLLARTVHGWFR